MIGYAEITPTRASRTAYDWAEQPESTSRGIAYATPSSGTISIVFGGHSVAQIPHPLQDLEAHDGVPGLVEDDGVVRAELPAEVAAGASVEVEDRPHRPPGRGGERRARDDGDRPFGQGVLSGRGARERGLEEAHRDPRHDRLEPLGGGGGVRLRLDRDELSDRGEHGVSGDDPGGAGERPQHDGVHDGQHRRTEVVGEGDRARVDRGHPRPRRGGELLGGPPGVGDDPAPVLQPVRHRNRPEEPGVEHDDDVGPQDRCPQRDGTVVDPGERRHGRAPSLDPEEREALRMPTVEERGLGEQLRSEDAALPATAVEPDLDHRNPRRGERPVPA